MTRRLAKTPPHEILRRTKELVLEGWCQHYWHTSDGRYCLEGAVWASCKREETSLAFAVLPASAEAVLGRVCLRLYPDRCAGDFGSEGTVTNRFNDHEATTLDDVIRVLDAAIVECTPPERAPKKTTSAQGAVEKPRGPDAALAEVKP